MNKKFSEQILSFAVMSGLLFLSSIYTFPYEEFFEAMLKFNKKAERADGLHCLEVYLL